MARFTQHVSITIGLMLMLINIISSSHPIVERHCDPRILMGYDQCLCDYTEQHVANPGFMLKAVNCTNMHFTQLESQARLRQLSTEINTAHYTGLERFTFIGNTIYELPVNLVGMENLESLTLLNLSHNHIHTIHGQTFHHMPVLTELDLSHNDWYVDEHAPRVFSSIFNLEILHLNNAFTTISPNNTKHPSHVTVLSKVFEGSMLDYLREIYLERNKLLSLDARVFQRLPSIEKISLAHNHINNLEGMWNSTCFPSNFTQKYMNLERLCPLTFLDLRYNSITTVPKSFLDELAKLKNFKTLYLHYNPFNCDCNLRDFRDWLRSDVDNAKYTIPNHVHLKCTNPPHMKGRPIITLTKDDLVCTQATFQAPSHNKAVGIVLGTMFGVIVALLLVALFINRDRAKVKAIHIWTNVSGYLPRWRGGYTKVDEPAKPVCV